MRVSDQMIEIRYVICPFTAHAKSVLFLLVVFVFVLRDDTNRKAARAIGNDEQKK